MNTRNEKITLANDQKVEVFGTAKVKLSTPYSKHRVLVYILESTSHPLILGTTYLQSKGIVLDFCQNQIQPTTFSVRSKSVVQLPPHTECQVLGKLPQSVHIGSQGLCVTSKLFSTKNCLVARALVTVHLSHNIPVRIYNHTNEHVTITKDHVLAKCDVLTNDYVVNMKHSADFSMLECNTVGVTSPDTENVNQRTESTVAVFPGPGEYF